MSNRKVLITETILENIAAEIKDKDESISTVTPAQMPDAIKNLPSGGIVSVSSVSIDTYSGTSQNRYLKPDGSEGKIDLAVSATVLPANATIKDVKWTSSNPAIASVIYDEANDTYKIHAVSAGTATITATSVESGESDSFTVVVSVPTWSVIQAYVRAGKILDLMNVGDVVPTTVDFKRSSTQTTAYDTGVRLVHLLNTAERQAKYGISSQGAIFQYKHGTVQGMQFDMPETALEADEETAQDGVYYYGWNSGNTYIPLNLNTGDTIPYGDYAKVYKSSINATGTYYNQIRGNGWNNWKYSMIRQWLNSNAAASSKEWFTPSHLGDGQPNDNLKNFAGWLADIDPALAAIITQVTITTSANTVTDGGETYTTQDKFFLPSKEEVFFNPQISGEGEAWDYYRAEAGYATPNDGNSPARIISQYPTNNVPYNPVNWWLRSAYRSSACYVWGGYSTGGYASGNYADYQYAIAPACVIS